MIKYICDNSECKKEIDTKDFFCEIVVREVKPFLMKGKKGGDQIMGEVLQRKHHLCQVCYNKFLQEAHI